MSPPPEGRDRHYWPEGEPAADRLGATQVIPSRGAPKITMPPPQSEDRMSLREKANAIFGEIGTRYEVTEVADNIKTAASGGTTKTGAGLGASIFDAVAGLFGRADNAQKIAIAAQQQIQDMQSEAEASGGTSWSTIFAGPDGTPVSASDFATTYLQIRGNNGHLGLSSSAPVGTHYAVTMHELETDAQSVSVVLGDYNSGGQNEFTSIVLRGNAAGTAGAYCRISDDIIGIGKVGGSQWYFIERNQNPGDQIRFRCSGDNYYVLVNGKQVISWTDTGASIAKGASYRHCAISMERDTAFFIDTFSYRVASFAMADWRPPGAAVSTPTWSLLRTTTSAANRGTGLPSGTGSVMPSAFYTLTEQSVDITVDNLGLGRVQITEDGTYEIGATSVCAPFQSGSSPENTWRGTPWVLFVDGVAKVGPIPHGVTIKWDLAAGQIAQPGIHSSFPAVNDSNIDLDQEIRFISGGPGAAFWGRKVA